METKWGHVDHQITREVLEQRSIDEDSICIALSFATECLLNDLYGGDELPYEVIDARHEAHCDAYDAWNLEGDTLSTIEALQRFWSV